MKPGKYVDKTHTERQYIPNPESNAYGTLVYVEDDGNEFPVSCGCGGSMWLCVTCKEKFLRGQEARPLLSQDEIDWVCQQVGRWIGIKSQAGQVTTSYDPTHSCLLPRLLSGREPLEDRPPRENGYPVYPEDDDDVV